MFVPFHHPIEGNPFNNAHAHINPAKIANDFLIFWEN